MKKNPVRAAAGRLGGRQRAKNLGKEGLSAAMTKAVKARWAKWREKHGVAA